MKLVCLFFLCVLFQNCTKDVYSSNGETIFRTGKNKDGKRLLDKEHSQITFVRSCQACHGKEGERNRQCVIKWSELSTPEKHAIPYTDSLFFRFLDEDLKSDGTAAQTGVHWNLSLQDKKDLLDYLKKL